MANTKNNKNKRTKRKKSAKKDKNTSFVVSAALLCVAIIVPVIILLVSVFLNSGANDKLNETMYPLKYESIVSKASQEYNVDECLIYGIIRTESNFNPDAVSQVGAIGLMQLMPDTFVWLQNYRSGYQAELLDSDELYDPEVNIDYGVYLLSYLIDRYNGNESLAICAYNAGHGNVDEWLADGTIPESGVMPDDIPFTETSNYLERVTTAKEMYNLLYFADTSF